MLQLHLARAFQRSEPARCSPPGQIASALRPFLVEPLVDLWQLDWVMTSEQNWYIRITCGVYYNGIARSRPQSAWLVSAGHSLRIRFPNKFPGNEHSAEHIPYWENHFLRPTRNQKRMDWCVSVEESPGHKPHSQYPEKSYGRRKMIWLYFNFKN